MSYYGEWAPYVPVAQRRRLAQKKMKQLRKKGMDIQPIEIDGRKIVKTFWGQAWCDHMESLGDFANRLPRGRTYVRNGSVCHLAIEKGQVTAMVSGSRLYEVNVKIDTLPKKKWTTVKSSCAGQIGSLLELLEGRLSDSVMKVVSDSNSGLFPLPEEIRLSCSCPDWATVCKHVAAVLYGVGARLDEQPNLLFLLRGVKHQELVSTNASEIVNRATRRGGKRRTLDSSDLGEVFGIELDTAAERKGNSASSKRPKKSAKKRPTSKGKKKPATSRRKKSKASKKAVSKSVAKKAPAKSAKKKSAKKKSPKKKVASKTPKKNGNKKTAKKPTKKKATPTRAPKKKTNARTTKKSVAKKRAVKSRSQSAAKTPARKKKAAKKR